MIDRAPRKQANSTLTETIQRLNRRERKKKHHCMKPVSLITTNRISLLLILIF